LLENDSVSTFPREPTRATIGRLLLGSGSIHTVESASSLYNGKFQGSSWLLAEVQRVQLKKSSFESIVVKNWVEFWRWHSKENEKEQQERNRAVQRRL
jgi:hypothetical protein